MASCSGSSNGYTLTLNVSQSSQSIANNTSTLSWSLVFRASNSYYQNDSTTDRFVVTINGSQVYNQLRAISFPGMNTSLTIASGTTTVGHAADGKKTVSFSCNFYPGRSASYYPGNIVGSSSMTLTTIPRASNFSFTAYSELGKAVTISISRASDSFTHKVEYGFAGSNWTAVTSSAATSSSFTPPVSLASQIPNDTAGNISVRVTTYNGSTQIGSSVSKSVSLKVPASVVPTMGTPTATRVDNGVPSTWDVYVQGYSKATISMTSPTGAYGSTIKSYSIIGPGLNTTTGAATTAVLTTVGTNTYTCTATDSRGRTVTKTVSVTVVAYEPPSIAVNAYRCDSDGTVTSNGTYLRVTADWTIASVSSKNSVASRSVTCNDVTNSTFADGAAFTLSANVSIGSQYTLTATVKDALGKSAAATITIPTAERIMNVKDNGKGIAFGGFAQHDSITRSYWPMELGSTISGSCLRGTTHPFSDAYGCVEVVTRTGSSGIFKGALLDINEGIMFNGTHRIENPETDKIQIDGRLFSTGAMVSQGYLYARANGGEVKIGSENSSYVHFVANRPVYFNQPIYSAGNEVVTRTRVPGMYRCGSMVTHTVAGDGRIVIHSNDQLNSLFGVSNCNGGTIAAFYCNGDFGANKTYGGPAVLYQDKWWLTFSSEPTTNGSIRVNYLYVYFGG